MSHSTRIALGYLAASVLWILVSDYILLTALPHHFTTISLYKGWAFVILSAGLLKIWLGAEERRRDRAECLLREQAIHDSLTGLLNRRAFTSHLENSLARARRSGTHLGVLFLDLDGFKAVNDTLGHAVGDILLRQVADRLRIALRNADVAARLGGDEFIVLVEPDSNKGSEILAARLVDLFRQPFDLDGQILTLSVSIGLSHYPDHGDDVDTLLSRADHAMYQGKNQGRNTYVVYSPLP